MNLGSHHIYGTHTPLDIDVRLSPLWCLERAREWRAWPLEAGFSLCQMCAFGMLFSVSRSLCSYLKMEI
jgi:hypothetical protein